MTHPLTVHRVAVALACLAAAGCGTASSSGGASNLGETRQAGSMAQDFTGREVSGRNFRLSDHLGKQTVLLNFWATYCQPCMAEFPHLRRIQKDLEKDGLLIVAVSMDGPETIADVPSFVSRNNVTFPVVVDEDSRIASLYNPRKSAPLSVLIDKGGRIVSVREGFNPGDEALLERDVKAALATTP